MMKNPALRPFRVFCLLIPVVSFSSATAAESDAAATAADPAAVSFSKQIKPIFQAHCQGCHQPAKNSGRYVMTDFAGLIGGGESESAAIVPGQPDDSYLVHQITPADGAAAMPPVGEPLAEVEIELIRRWIQQGAVDDSPAGTHEPFSRDNPPRYSRPPVVTSLDFAPDGSLLAVAGFNEVLLYQSDGSQLVDRLIGLSERIESVRFSPDGTRLAVTGGQPGRLGELQIWDVAKRELLLSHLVTYDTIYGASWSPDGKLIAFGGADNVVRAVNAETGEQVLFQGAHSDWIRDTVFTTDSSHLLSVARDMTVKLTEVATNRFIDNVTSITPGALKGGINSIARHPERDEVVVGGSDGTPKVYRVFRITARQIGDDANLIRTLNPMTGRVFGVSVSRDGTRIAAVSALDGAGELAVYSYEFDTNLPDDLKQISGKRVAQRSAEEQQKLDEYRSKDIRRIAEVKVPGSALYALAFHPNSRQVAAAGGDGTVRLVDTETGTIVREFSAAPTTSAAVPETQLTQSSAAADSSQTAEATTSLTERYRSLSWSDSPLLQQESLPADAIVTGLTVQPESIALNTPFEYTQLLVSASLASGDTVDVTRIARIQADNATVAISGSGFVKPEQDGADRLTVSVGDQQVHVPVTVSGMTEVFQADFIEHVNPVLSRVGCNQGTCHGSKDGRNGFKLSLRGYDPLFDVRALTDDLAARRVNLASPADSLMLLKATGTVPHEGQQVFKPDSNYYEIVRNWVADGAGLNRAAPRVVSIAVAPENPVIQQLRSTQQIRIVATYSDGRSKDVTREAFIESGNTEVAAANRWGLVTALRRGEAPLLARFEGSYAATTLTVMGDRDGFEWQTPETWSEIDQHVANKWERMKIAPSGLCTDAEFLRRVYLDLTGLPPTADEVRAFLADGRDSRSKRAEVVDRLVGSDAYVEYWSNKWADLLQVNRKFLGPEGAVGFRDWIRAEVKANTPYDDFVRKVITADGSNKDNPAASYYKILREPADIMENTTHLFLGVRFNCNKCHDHPFERWTQDQYYQTAAWFARVGLKADPASGDRRIGGTAVEGAKPYYEVVFEKSDGEITHDRTGEVTAPEFPYDCDFQTADDADRREQLAAWITSPDNQYFARSYVNRLWGYLLGVGIMEPIDDLRAGNPPTNPELLDYLTAEFINSGFNVQHVVSLICKSRTYQLSLETNPWNEDDTQNYSHAIARRLPAEVLYDAIHQVTGSVSKIPGVPDGTRAAAIPDSGIELPDGFLANLGRPPRESACECERSADLQLGPIMALIGGPTVGTALADPDNQIAKLVNTVQDDRQLVDELFLRIFNRPATDAEIDAALKSMQAIAADHQQLVQHLAEREDWWKTEKPRLEQLRQEAIAAAEAELQAYEASIAPRRAEEEQARLARVAELEAEYNNYQATLPERANQYLQQQSAADTEWHLLEPIALEAVAGIKLERLDDRSVKASGTADTGAYTVTVRTTLKDITAFRIEALPDASVEGNGPGLPKNGNFVVTEFDVQAGPAAAADQLQKVTLQNAKADFLQDGFNIDLTIDGNAGNQNAWAVANAGGVVHWATYETQAPVGHEGGTLLKFVIHQNHNAKGHLLARFRISATTKAQPGLGLPESLQAAALVPAEQRSEAVQQTLLSWIEKTDSGLTQKQTAVNAARQPLPEDPGVTERKERLAFVSQEVPEDARLVQLRSDVEFSTRQQESQRLTMAQDLAWALINNPAFLFNH